MACAATDGLRAVVESCGREEPDAQVSRFASRFRFSLCSRSRALTKEIQDANHNWRTLQQPHVTNVYMGKFWGDRKAYSSLSAGSLAELLSQFEKKIHVQRKGDTR